MGELSKVIGDQGENIIEYFFKELIGFKNYRGNISLDCNFEIEHAEEDSKERRTHGLDGVVSYNCPLIDNLLEIGIISVKNKKDKYPTKKTFASKFKAYFKELAYMLACFKYSDEYSAINSKATGVNSTQITGILFWLSNDDESVNGKGNILSDIPSNLMYGENLFFDKIFIVDNDRLEFLYNNLQYLKDKFGSDGYDFVYPKTGMNLNPQENKNFGNKMPLQFLASNIIPLRIKEKNEVYFYILVRDQYDEDSLIKLIGLSKNFNQLEATTKTVISFPDYNKTLHSESIKKTLALFNDDSYSNQIEVVKHGIDFRNT